MVTWSEGDVLTAGSLNVSTPVLEDTAPVDVLIIGTGSENTQSAYAIIGSMVVTATHKDNFLHGMLLYGDIRRVDEGYFLLGGTNTNSMFGVQHNLPALGDDANAVEVTANESSGSLFLPYTAYLQSGVPYTITLSTKCNAGSTGFSGSAYPVGTGFR